MIQLIDATFSQESSVNIRLEKSDGDLVDVIHTSKNGYQQPIGHMDFFPNGGRNQVRDLIN